MNQVNFSVVPLTLEQVRMVYAERMTQDFPPDELKPLSMIERMLMRGEYTGYGAMAGENLLAYALFVTLKEDACALLDYYAVESAHRDRGIGGAFLRALVSGPLQDMRGVLLEIEDPEAAQSGDERLLRERRRQFYDRNGMKDSSVSARIFGVDFLLLAMPVGPELSPDDVRRMYARLYHIMLPQSTYEKQVIIH